MMRDPARITEPAGWLWAASARRRIALMRATRSRGLNCFVFKDTATTEIYTRKDTLSLHDALPISGRLRGDERRRGRGPRRRDVRDGGGDGARDERRPGARRGEQPGRGTSAGGLLTGA